jgi:chromosome segregation ATPase
VVTRFPANEATLEILERRWFAAQKAASDARGECETLLEAIDVVKAEWSRARRRLVRLEQLRDSLGEEIAAADAVRDARTRPPAARETADPGRQARPAA